MGIYVGESEGANCWLGVLNDLKNRGIEDILIACVDGLKGFKEVINTIFPKIETTVSWNTKCREKMDDANQ